MVTDRKAIDSQLGGGDQKSDRRSCRDSPFNQTSIEGSTPQEQIGNGKTNNMPRTIAGHESLFPSIDGGFGKQGMDQAGHGIGK